MGRYYKTANPQTLDFMYKLPEQYMYAAVQQASKDITENQAAMYDLYGKLQLNALSKDKPRAKEILAGYENSINEIAAELQADPLSFRRKGGDLLGLSRQMHKDFTRGEAAAIQSNYNVDAEWQKDYDKLAREGKLDHANWIQALRAKNLGNYKGVGYNSSTGNYNSYSPDNLVSYVNLDEELAKTVKEIEKEVRASSSARVEMVQGADGKMIRETSQTTEKRIRDEILQVASEKFYNDPKIQAFIRQGSDIGMLSGYYNKDAEGNLTSQISPFKMDEKGNYILDKNKQLITNPESTAARKFESLVTRFAVDNVTASKNSLKNLSSGSGSGGGRRPGDPLNAIIDGKQVVDPVSYLGSNSGNPYADAEQRASYLDNPDTDKAITTPILGYLNDAVKRGDFKNNADATKLISTIGTYIQSNDIEGLKSLTKGKTNTGWIRKVNDAISAVEENHIQAHNIRAQTNLYNETAVQISAKTGTHITGEELMKQKMTFTQPVLETRGEYYNFKPEDKEIFNSAATDISKQIAHDYQQGSSMIVWDHEKNVIKEYTNEKFNELVKPTQKDKRGGKTGTSGTPSIGQPISITDVGKSSSGSGLNPIGEIGEGMQMVEGRIAYTYTDENGVEQTAIATQPFTKKINTLDGKKLSIIYPRERINPSAALNDLDSRYQYKNEVKFKTNDINVMVRGIREIAKDYGVTPSISSNSSTFKLNDKTTFTPDLKGGLGMYNVNGKIGLEDEAIYDEYEKSENQ